jgi:alcohol dehydrogenase
MFVHPVFPFRVPPVMHFGVGAVSRVGEEARRLRAERVLLIADSGVARAGVAERVKQGLNDAGIEVEVYSDIAGEPTLQSVEACVAIARANRYDLLIGLGGGSAMDTAKACSLLLGNPGPISEYFGVERVPARGTPIILIPTTAGTASEVSPGTIVADTERELKIGVVSQHLIADVAIVDPELTLGVPPAVTAATGMDALTHAVESYLARKATPHTRMYSLEATRHIGAHLRQAVWNGGDVESRYYMSLGSFLAGFPMVNAGTGLVHAMAYPLGGQFHITHGVANALLLPHVMEFNLPAAVPQFAVLAEALGEPIVGLSPRAAAEMLVAAIRELSADVGIPQRLRDLAVPESALEGMVPGALSATRLTENNCRLATPEDCLNIYRQAW